MNQERAIGWVAHPHMRRGEALSSWLARYAWANGLSPHSFTRTAFGEAEVWTRDIDRTVSVEMLCAVGGLAGATPAQLAASVMRSYAGTVFDGELIGAPFIPWITPAGVYHRIRRHHGSAYCPRCLRDYGYSRLDWRLAWMVHCPRHERPLLDACPRCDAPFVFHRMAAEAGGALPCISCGYDIARDAPCRPITMGARQLQRALTCCAAGHPRTVGNVTLTALDFTTGVRVLARGLFPNGHLEGLVGGLRSSLRAHLERPVTGLHGSLEYWRIQDRAVALAYLSEVLKDWPETLLKCLGVARVCPSRFTDKRMPPWVAEVLRRRSAIKR